MIKGMIFDLDGTLIDSMGVWDQIDAAFLGKRGLAVPPDYLETITPMGFLNAALYTKERFGFPETPEELEEEWMSMAEHAYASRIAMRRGARTFLLSCREAGYQMALATSSLDRLINPCLKHHGIEDLFQAVVTTRQAGEDKHSPRIYQMAAEQMELAPGECVVFEDILQGIETAKAAGFYAVGIREDASAKDHAAMRERADLFLDHYEGITAEQLITSLERSAGA